MKNKSRQVISTAIITSLLSILIGGFAIWGSYSAEISIIDDHMAVVASNVNSNPTDAITSALLSLDQNSYDFTLAFTTQDGSVTVLKESKNAILGSNTHLRTREISIQEGEVLIISASLSDIDKNLENEPRPSGWLRTCSSSASSPCFKICLTAISVFL